MNEPRKGIVTLTKCSIQISVIIPAKNASDYLASCLKSLDRQNLDRKFFEVIVVNNMSYDSTVEIAQNFGAIVKNCDATNAAGVRNSGAEIARGNVFAFLDSDCIVPRNWLKDIHCYFSQDFTSRSIVGGTCLSPVDGTFVEKNWAPSFTIYEGPVKALPGANMALTRECFSQLQGFNDKLKSAEDDEFCARARKIDIKVLSKKCLAVVHLGYPKSLYELFGKMVSHGETQLKAHGFFGDKVVILTWIWLLEFLITPFVFVLDLSLFPMLVLLLLCPFMFSVARLRRAPISIAFKLIPKTFLVSLVALSGRLVGLIKEIYKLIGNVLRKVDGVYLD